MFNNHYHFKFRVKKKPLIGEDFEYTLVYWFEDKNKVRYVVNLEKYSSHLYALKFHLFKDKKNKNKYSILTNTGNPQPVLGTCLKVLIKHFKENPYSSYIIFGMAGLNEQRNATKRFRIYKRILENMISPVEFEHRLSEAQSAYLLLNRNVNNQQAILDFLDSKLDINHSL